MGRNSSGSYSLPAGNPVIAGTLVSPSWANSTLSDLGGEIGSSLDRTGRGGMLASLRGVDGSAAAPAVSFTSEPGTGWYRAAAADLRAALAGVDALTVTVFGLFHSAARFFLSSTAANSTVQVRGNRAATDTGADVELNGQATRTAGLLLQVNNNGIPKLNIDYQGLMALASQAGPLQPASLWTAITPNANWTAGSGLAYWKDPCGLLHLKGTATFATGAATGVFTLPAGFRPISTRTPLGLDTSVAAVSPVTVNIDAATGLVSIFGVTLVNTHVYSFDGVNFLAEQ